ncbi:MAG TPA: hypothetical protein VF536_00415 [Roseateles sp.]
MSFEEVAESFVESGKFQELAGHWNSLLVGPRGSGKTTLLKMLSLSGLRAWKGKDAETYRQSLRYTGIYVPTDIAWGEMVNGLGDGKLDPAFRDIVSEAAFTTNVLLATTDAIQQRLQTNASGSNYRAVSLSPDSTREFVDGVAQLWKLQTRAPSLRSLHLALSTRLLDIRQKASLAASREELSLEDLQGLMPYVGIQAIEAVSLGLKLFDELIEEPDGLWVLLLDEFEVAPLPLQRVALSALRAASQKLLIKVALAPCGPHTLLDMQSAVPTEKNDYHQVELWYPDKGEADDFCRRVFEAKVNSHAALRGKGPEEIFGRSQYAIVDELDSGGDRPAGHSRTDAWSSEFLNLAFKDQSFQDFLTRRQIDAHDLDSSSSTIRKIAPVVAFRNAYRGTGEGKKRGRKPYASAYSGWQAVSAISEGNPRWLLSMLTGMFSEVAGSESFPIGVAVQQRKIASTSGIFAEMLRTVAAQQQQIVTSVPIFKMLEDIGSYFHDRIVSGEFQEDPHLSFEVDDKVSDDQEACLRIALNHGAIVCYERPDVLGGYRSLRNKRFRLAYLLAPVFKLPLRKSKQIRLSSILEREEKPIRAKNSLETIPKSGDVQGSLF